MSLVLIRVVVSYILIHAKSRVPFSDRLPEILLKLAKTSCERLARILQFSQLIGPRANGPSPRQRIFRRCALSSYPSHYTAVNLGTSFIVRLGCVRPSRALLTDLS